MKTKKNLKVAVVLFAMIFAVGAAFAATNGMLAFGGAVRINSVGTTEEVQVEFIGVSEWIPEYEHMGSTGWYWPSAVIRFSDYINSEVQIIEENRSQRISFNYDIDIEHLIEYSFEPSGDRWFILCTGGAGINWDFGFFFTLENTGTVPTKITGFEHSDNSIPFLITIDEDSRSNNLFYSSSSNFNRGMVFYTSNFPDDFRRVAPELNTNTYITIAPGETTVGAVWFNILILDEFLNSQDYLSFGSQFILTYEQAR